jgi:hypothetical protein
MPCFLLQLKLFTKFDGHENNGLADVMMKSKPWQREKKFLEKTVDCLTHSFDCRLEKKMDAEVCSSKMNCSGILNRNNCSKMRFD